MLKFKVFAKKAIRKGFSVLGLEVKRIKKHPVEQQPPIEKHPLDTMVFSRPYFIWYLKHIDEVFGFKDKDVYEIGADVNLECAQAAIQLGAKSLHAANPLIELDTPPHEKITMQKVLGENSRLESEKFDLIYGFALLEHVLNPKELAVEVHRLLRVGGSAILSGYAMWPSEDSHHVYFHDNDRYRFDLPDKCVYDEKWYHVTHPAKDEFAQYMQARNVPEEDIARLYNQAYESDMLSRITSTQLIEVFKSTEGLDVHVIKSYTDISPNEHYYKAMKHYSEEDLKTVGLILHIKKIKSFKQRHYDFFSANWMSAEYFMQSVVSFFVRENDKVIDVGANHGLHTEHLAKLVSKNGCVYAFEAVPQLAVQLREKFADTFVKIINKAVTCKENSNKDISFHYVKELDGYSGIKRREVVKNEWEVEIITVQTTTLDDSIGVNEKISFIKIDTEGGDFDVLKGARRILTESKPLVVFEFGGSHAAEAYGYTNEEFFLFFEEIGYSLYQYTGGIYGGHNVPETFWELWAVPKNAEYEYFFKRNISYFADFWLEQGKGVKFNKVW
ncbi:MAG: FkbM family methyltransferase [Spirochaetes bacterium]|nr:FkbM family methyltransferase [Spirochaetota bacterium]